AESFPNWRNNLIAADHYLFIKNCEKANLYFQICLIKATSDDEKATVLHNLGILHRLNNEFKQASQSFQKALVIRKELAAVDPQRYLQDLGTTLTNLANIYSENWVLDKASEFYEEAIRIRRKLATNNSEK